MSKPEDILKSVVEKTVEENINPEDGTGMTLEEIKEQEAHADAVLAASDPDKCSYEKGYVTRQARLSIDFKLKTLNSIGNIFSFD